MYAYLEGKFTYKSPGLVFLDINGVGYEVNISLNTYSDIQKLEKGRLYTYFQVKEDGHTLFGFSEQREKEIFQYLISVSGVGAATARMMLSSMKPEEVAMAIMQGNTRALENVKGIGKKTAERLVLELRDKVGKQSSSVSGLAANNGNSLEADALTALTSLGITRVQAETAIKKVVSSNNTINHLEDLIKQALKAI
jgi:holliday junction DNA helicase RuvA